MSAVAIVTGAAAGIGKATASLLADQGFRVIGVDSRGHESPAAGTGPPGVALGGDPVAWIRGDVADPRTGAACVELAARSGPVEVLVNCAAVRTRADAAHTDEQIWRRTVEVNLTGPFLMAAAVLPHMLARGRGTIINVGSLAGEGRPGMLAYCASKGGVAAMTKALALDVADRGIRVNLVVPGITVEAATPAAPGRAARARHNSVLGRPNTPAEVAEVIGWLCVAAGPISGTVIEVGTLPRYPQEPVPIAADASDVRHTTDTSS